MQIATGDPFFDVVTYCGAFEPSLSVIVPWNEPGPVAPMPAVPPSTPFGYLLVQIGSNQIGTLGGVRISLGNTLAVSDFNGFARLYLASGLQSYTLQNLPPGCVDPGLFFINVPANGSTGQTAVIQC